jgi:hypothetical protein
LHAHMMLTEMVLVHVTSYAKLCAG